MNVHYFQRYSGQENVLTNATLHLLMQLNLHSTEKLRVLLADLLGDEEVPLGISFAQQKRSGGAVPDGVILQEPLHLLIETKIDAHVDVNQLLRHCTTFSPHRPGNYLLLLTRDGAEVVDLVPVLKKAKEVGATFRHATFEELCKGVLESVLPHETALQLIAFDYQNYCEEMGALPDRRVRMRIVPCGWSIEWNARWAIYYQPTSRGYTDHDYLGIYKNRRVQFIGEVKAVVDCNVVDGVPQPIHWVKGESHAEACLKSVAGIVAESRERAGIDVSDGHRFFWVEEFAETDFHKDTPGGIQGARFYDLTELQARAPRLDDLARLLRDESWS